MYIKEPSIWIHGILSSDIVDPKNYFLRKKFLVSIHQYYNNFKAI